MAGTLMTPHLPPPDTPTLVQVQSSLWVTSPASSLPLSVLLFSTPQAGRNLKSQRGLTAQNPALASQLYQQNLVYLPALSLRGPYLGLSSRPSHLSFPTSFPSFPATQGTLLITTLVKAAPSSYRINLFEYYIYLE